MKYIKNFFYWYRDTILRSPKISLGIDAFIIMFFILSLIGGVGPLWAIIVGLVAAVIDAVFEIIRLFRSSADVKDQ